METGSCHQSRNHSFRTAPFRRVCLVRRYIDNTDFKQLNLFWQSELKSEEADFQFQAGYNDKGYGANSFYSASYPNQYDKTRRFFLSAGGETHGKIKFTPKVYWTRHSTGTSCSVAIPPIGIPGIITMRRKYLEPTSTPRHSGN